MGNKNYVRGVKFERELVNEARDKGFVAFRSAGSHSLADVCIWNPKGLWIQLIQCKTKKGTKFEGKAIQNRIKTEGYTVEYFKAIKYIK